MIYFLHISKCAGSSFVDLARRNVRLFRPNANGNPLNPLTGKRFSFWNWTSDEQQYLLSSSQWDLIANENHLGRDAQFYEGVTYVTILRDPIDRLFSHYQFNHSNDDAKIPLEQRGRAFVRFLKREQTISWRRNSLVSALTYPTRKEKTTPARLKLAKQRLEEFDHVFLMEQLSEQVQVFSRHGWSKLAIAWRKANGQAESAFAWSAARTALAPYKRTLDKLIEANEADLELYAYGRELVQRRTRQLPSLNRTSMRRTGSIPESGNFEFLCYCAYDQFVGGELKRCKELLRQAETLPLARDIDCHGAATLSEFAMSRFAAPEEVETERLARSRQRLSAPEPV